MEREAILHTTPTKDVVRDDHSAFNPQWQPDDAATLLQPTNFAIPKITRAWERKPLSPFSRSRVRVGKVWKRPGAMSRPPRYAVGNEVTMERDAKRQRRRSSGQEPGKPIKKICLDSRFGLAPSVVGWETSESPARKIVTRSTAVGQEILALDEEEEGDDLEQTLASDLEALDGDVTVEILNEDGSVLDVDPDEAVRDTAWQDEDEVNGDEASLEDATSLPALSDRTDDVPAPADAIAENEATTLSTEAITEDHPIAVELGHQQDFTSLGNEKLLLAHEIQQPTLYPQEMGLPDGFVSPAKRRIAKIGKRRSLGSRRRTLPVQFAPALIEESLPEDIQAPNAPAVNVNVHQVILSTEQASDHVLTAIGDSVSDDTKDSKQDEQNWEDVETSDSEDDVTDVENLLPTTAERAENAQDLPVEQEFMQSDKPKSPLDHLTVAKLPSSPIPSIEGQHPRLPLRRSPRRKSSSPLKHSTILPSSERSHLIAFTPLRDAPFLRQRRFQDFTETIDVSEEVNQDPPSPSERALSAPPEEPCMSERKMSRPRVSDDTALLQAFLDRAAESKAPPRATSVSKRESLSNRRDSDAVRQALASPAKPAEVLGELDPNSPSPRKATATPLSNIFDNVIEEAAKKVDDATTVASGEEDGTRTRRSGRTARKAIQSTPAPVTTANKISIRGPNGDGVVLKRSDAQELALLTRNNTRKNKGGAILPPLRLTKMAMVFGQLPNGVTPKEETDEGTSEKEKDWWKKGVRWAETLVEFYQGPNGEVIESSVLSDELNAPAEVEGDKVATTPASTDFGTGVAPPPAETPSKPKIRRLKAPRTAAAPGNPPATPAPALAQETNAPSSDNSVSHPTSLKPATQAQTKRRSRIATPAKGLTNASLLPTMDLDPQPIVPATSETKAAAPVQQKKRKAPVSKLPAPASTMATAPTPASTALGQGKENNNTLTSSLLLSPPKKKVASAAALSGPKPAFAAAPKLDFGNRTRLEPPAAANGEDDSIVPGLMSPAKKGGRTRMVPGLGARKGDDGGEEVNGAGETKMLSSSLGMGSPAKKRTRRAI